jgi:hypothetical protein
MDKENAKRIDTLEERVAVLEKALTQTDKSDRNSIEIDLTLPEAEIDGLFFNEQSVHALFEKGDDGWYYSRDILFLSARNVIDDNSRDILRRYLEDAGGDREIRAQIADMFDAPPTAIEIALPKKPQGIKKYHGVDWWYWLADSYAGSAAYFAFVHATGGGANHSTASAVGGCAPAFRVAERHG